MKVAGGAEYAKVADRMKEFREANPKGKVDTSFTQLPDGQMVLKAEITKEDGSIATGQAMGPLEKEKAFEKLETIAVGRALAFLGYLASGEIASSEEMEEFIADQKQKQEQVLEDAEVALNQCETLDKLRTVFTGLGRGLMADPQLIAIKDTLKTKLS